MNCSDNIAFTNDRAHAEDLRVSFYLVIRRKSQVLTMQINSASVEDYCMLNVIPYSLIDSCQRFKGSCYLHLNLYLKDGGNMFLRNVGNSYQTTQHHIPQYSNLDSHRHVKIKSPGDNITPE
jgi:hypothetical protein